MATTPDKLYSTLAEIQLLLAGGRTWSNARLHADDMLSAEEEAKFAGADPELLIRDAADGRLIGIPTGAKGMVFPKWQFTAVFKSAIYAVSQARSTAHGWTLLRFFDSPHVGLDELSPKHAIEQGYSVVRIVDLARAWGCS